MLTPKTIHNIDLKFDIIIKSNLRNYKGNDEYNTFIIDEVLRLIWFLSTTFNRWRN